MTDDMVIVVQKGDHSLGYYDLASGREIDRMPLDAYPHECAVSSDGRYLYICHFGLALAEDEGPGGHTVSVVDIGARRRIGVLDCAPYRRPHGIAIDRQNRLYVLSEANSQLLFSSEPLSLKFTATQPTGGLGSHIASVSAEGKRVFSSNMKSNTLSVIFMDQERDPISIPIGARPEGSVLDLAQQKLYVACRESAEIAVIDIHTLQALASIKTGPGPVRLCWDDRQRLLAPLYHAASLAVIDPGQPDRQQLIALPDKPISISFDATTGLALASLHGDQIAVINCAIPQVCQLISTRADPDPALIVRA